MFKELVVGLEDHLIHALPALCVYAVLSIACGVFSALQLSLPILRTHLTYVAQFYAPMGAEFGASSSQLSYLTGSMILLLGVGNLLFIPLAAAHGRRPALAIANVRYILISPLLQLIGTNMPRSCAPHRLSGKLGRRATAA